MSSNISRRSFLKGTVAGVAGLAASRLVGTPVQQAAAEASAEPQFASAQQASSALLNPQSCAIFRYDDAPVMKDTKLFTPWQFGGLTIGNRLVKSAAGSAYLPTETPENIINEYTNWAKGGVKLEGARWFGKVSTVVFYTVMILIVLFPNIPQAVTIALLVLAVGCAVVAGLLYLPEYKRYKAKRDQNPKK